MISELAYFCKRIVGADRAGRSLIVLPDDTFIVSFPRSGNTWTRFLVANLVHSNESITFANIDRLIPDIHNRSKRYLRSIPRPRILKSHEYFDPRYKRVIYIVRDPRDVVVSSYYFHLKQRQIEDAYPIQRYVNEFIAGSVWTDFASWGQNVSSWLATRQGRIQPLGARSAENITGMSAPRQNPDDFLLLRYEDMVEDPHKELSKIATFLAIPSTQERVDQAIQSSSADQMRKLEKAEAHKWLLTKSTRKDIPFVRKAAQGGWKDTLSPTSVADIESAWSSIMRELGYELHEKSFIETGQIASS